jgi:hypothetical protein
MANNLNTKHYEVDTVGVVTTDAVIIERISWKNATAAGHTVRVVTGTGTFVWEHFASGAIANVSEPLGLQCGSGINVTALSSGKLYILVR